MVLAEAFMKRNDLKKKLVEYTKYATQNLWEDVELPINFEARGAIRPEKVYEEIQATQKELMELNIKIAFANTTNIPVLQELDAVKSSIAILQQVIKKIEMYPGDKIRGSYSDSERVHENHWLIDVVAIRENLKKAESRKREIERELVSRNAKIEI